MEYEGSYGIVTVGDYDVVKSFKDTNDKNIFWKEVIIHTILDFDCFAKMYYYDYDSRTITLEKYQYDLLRLGESLPLHKRLYLVKQILDQCLNAVQIMHKLGIVHADIRADNIFCNFDEDEMTIQCFIGDFSIATIDNIGDNYDNYMMYKPPEYIYDKQIDIWMLAMAVIQFVTGGRVLSENYDDDFYNFEQQVGYLIFDNKTSNLLKSMLRVDPEKRLKYKTEGRNIKAYLNASLKNKKILKDKELCTIFSNCHRILSDNSNTDNSYEFDELDGLDLSLLSDLGKKINFCKKNYFEWEDFESFENRITDYCNSKKKSKKVKLYNQKIQEGA